MVSNLFVDRIIHRFSNLVTCGPLHYSQDSVFTRKAKGNSRGCSVFWVHASACEMRLATLRSRPEAGQVRGIPVSTGRRASSATVLSLPPLSSYF